MSDPSDILAVKARPSSVVLSAWGVTKSASGSWVWAGMGSREGYCKSSSGGMSLSHNTGGVSVKYSEPEVQNKGNICTGLSLAGKICKAYLTVRVGRVR